MSQMKELYNKVANDKALQAKFAEIMKDASEEKLVAFAKEAGFDVSVDDVKAYMADKAKGELSENDLDMVAGGKADVYKVFESIATLGIGCAAQSYAESVQGRDCNAYFQE